MKRFAWRLQRVLEIKTKEVEAKRAELFRITKALAEKQAELITKQTILKELLRTITQKELRERLEQQEFFFRHSAANIETIEKIKENIRELEVKQKEKMAEVLQLNRFKEGLERLRAEAKREFIKEQEKLEQKDLDEIGKIGFLRKRAMA
jgi:flagellar biosynthesis chaperone FliJ